MRISQWIFDINSLSTPLTHGEQQLPGHSGSAFHKPSSPMSLTINHALRTCFVWPNYCRLHNGSFDTWILPLPHQQIRCCTVSAFFTSTRLSSDVVEQVSGLIDKGLYEGYYRIERSQVLNLNMKVEKGSEMYFITQCDANEST